MKAESCREWRESLGAHALGRLSGEERAALEAHLEGCAECRAELESLSVVAQLMPLADPESFATEPQPPPALADKVVSAVHTERRTQRRRRFRLGLAVGGATAAVTVALLVFFAFPGEESRGRHVDFGSLPAGVEISARLEPRPFGTEVHVYVKGARPGTLCRVFLRGPDGARLSAGSFRYRKGDDSNAILSSALALRRAEALGVRVGGRTFLAPVPPAGSA